MSGNGKDEEQLGAAFQTKLGARRSRKEGPLIQEAACEERKVNAKEEKEYKGGISPGERQHEGQKKKPFNNDQSANCNCLGSRGG